MRLQSYIKDDDLMSIIETLIIIDECHKIGKLNEGIVDSIASAAKRVKEIITKKKPEVSKLIDKEKGLVGYMKDLGLGGSQLMYHAFNAYYNKNAESKAMVKELSHSVKKEHVVDILLKLDVLSLHLVTGPLHIIEAVTGWGVMHHIKSKLEPVDKKVTSAIQSLESLKDALSGEIKVQMLRYTNALRRVFGVGNYQKIK